MLQLLRTQHVTVMTVDLKMKNVATTVANEYAELAKQIEIHPPTPPLRERTMYQCTQSDKAALMKMTNTKVNCLVCNFTV